jgi:hypothetical protein
MTAFDLSAIQNALSSRLSACPSCGGHSWTLPTGTNFIGAGTRPDGELDFTLGFEVLAAICECGFVVMYEIGRLG